MLANFMQKISPPNNTEFIVIVVHVKTGAPKQFQNRIELNFKEPSDFKINWSEICGLKLQ